ncbi:MAG: uroporphyrinogen-III synthase [Muribaculaceae bacterium]|nr:uroporphyrinogen-III synthase [Muribaculaceae bacterium]
MKKILVSQPKPASDKSPYYDLQKRFDVEIVFRPFIKVEGLVAREFRQSRIAIPDYTAIIFTARTAVDHFFRLCSETRYQVPDTLKYFCVSEAIAYYLQKYVVYRKRRIFYSESGKIEDLLPIIDKHNKETYLMPVSDVHDDSKATVLDEHGIKYTSAVMYRTVSNDFKPGEPFDYDMLIFFSPAGVKSLKTNFPDFNQGDIAIGAMGNSTIEAVKEAGLRLDITTTPDAPSMAAAIKKFIKKNYPQLEKDDE